MEKRSLLMKAMPFFFFVFGFLTLNMFQGYVGGAYIVIGIVMLMERIWPEKWDEETN